MSKKITMVSFDEKPLRKVKELFKFMNSNLKKIGNEFMNWNLHFPSMEMKTPFKNNKDIELYLKHKGFKPCICPGILEMPGFMIVNSNKTKTYISLHDFNMIGISNSAKIGSYVGKKPENPEVLDFLIKGVNIK